MRKILFLFVCLFVLVLSACNDSKEQTEPDSSTTKDNEITNSGESKDNNDQGVQEGKEGQESDLESKENQEEDNNSTPADPEKLDEEEEEVSPVYELNDKDWSIQPISNDVNDQVVLLTIDDAPDAHALEMAELLNSLDAKAIFFVNGHFLDTEEERDTLRQIHEMGFEIGNHTYNHQALPDVSEQKQREEIVSLNDLVEEIIGERPKFFRAPHGQNTDYSKQLVKEEGMLLMNWTYGYDYFQPYMDAEKLAVAMVTGEGPEVDVPYSLLKNGANLLMHDREWTAAALEDIVTGLRDKGYEMVDPALIKTP